MWKHAIRTSRNAIAGSVASERHFHFASHDYMRTFRDLPKPDIEAIRNSSKVYLQSFDPQLWYDDPVRRIQCASAVDFYGSIKKF